MDKFRPSLCRVCNIVLPTHITNAHTPYCKPAQQEMADAISCCGLTHAPNRTSEFDRKNTIIGQVCGKAATATNEHIATIAALPSFENNY